MFRLAVEASPTGMFLVDESGRIALVNGEIERMFGYGRDELLQRPIEMLVPDDIRPRHPQLRSGYLADPQRRPMGAGRDLRGKRKDGSTFPVEIGLTPAQTASGTVVLGAVVDTSERRAGEEMFRLAVEASPTGMLLVDADGHLQLVNGEIERMFGYDRDELLQQRVEVLVPVSIRGRHPQLRSGFLKAPHRRPMGVGLDLKGQRKDGSTFPVEIGLTPVPARDGMLVLAAVVDISARRRAEETIAQHTRELERSNDDLEQFAYVASHDLQEPLRMVASFSQLLATRYEGQLDERADKYIGYVVDGATRMQALINDLLEYSRVGSRAKSGVPTDANAVARGVVASMGPAIAEAGAIVEVGDLPTVIVDPAQLSRLLQNLLSNAVKFHGDAAPRVVVAATCEGAECHFTVADNGIGFDETDTKRIFEMFQRLHSRGEYDGTGLGLAICKRIVSLYGGRIWARSKPGKGTTMHFTLPRAPEEQP